jgi:hypothetical protein
VAEDTALGLRLRKHLGQRTVLGVAIPVIEGTLADLGSISDFPGVTEREIEVRFKELSKAFNGSDYHSTYLHRRLGPKGFLEERNGKYRIQEPLLTEVSAEVLASLCAELTASVRSEFERRQEQIARLEGAGALPDEDIDARLAVVDQFLSQLTGNRGESFEVMSYAILREYFRCLGFSLQRFSTTYANDGGMDFVAGQAIYQVSVDESLKKIQDDLRKSPGTGRVLVRPREVTDFLELSRRGVLTTIDVRDLLGHFAAWLVARDTKSKRSIHMQNVIHTAIEEFRRENNAESA